MFEEQNTFFYNGNQKLKKAGVSVTLNVFQQQEFVRCMLDVMYFIKTYVKTVSLDFGLVPFELYPYQEKMISHMHENRFSIFMTSRQMGKTTTAAGYLLHQLIFNRQFTVAILANKGEQSVEVLARIKAMYEELPLWMQPGVKKWNEKSIYMGNKSRAFCATTSPSSIRGKSINILYIDEFAHIENDVEFYQSTYPVIMSGKTTKVIITSTPNGLNLFYKIWSESEDGRNDYKSLRVFWHEHPERDAQWLVTQERNMPPKQIAQEVHCEFLGSSDTLISGAKLQKMVHKTPIREENDGAYLIYAEPVEGHSYVGIADTSEGVGLDYSVCTVIDVTQQPYRIAAKYRSNAVPPLLFAKSCYEIFTRYNEAFAIVESNNSSGAIVCDELWNTYEYENMVTTKTSGGENRVTGGSRSIPGIRTTVRTKGIGCSSLKSLVESDLLVIEDFDMIQELSTFCLDATGKTYKASKGKHDDTAMTLVLFGWFANEPYFTEMVDLNIRQILRDRLEDNSDFHMLTVYYDDGLEDFEEIIESLPF